MNLKEGEAARIKLTFDDLQKAVTARGNRPYPHHEPQPGEPEWRAITAFGITGWFTNSDGIATRFGGYFNFDPKTQGLEGELVDIIGNSYIEGKLRPRKSELYFLKTYQDRPGIEYYFERYKNLWIGEYRMDKKEGGKVGRAEAMLIKFHSNAFGMISGPFGAYEAHLRKQISKNSSLPWNL